MKDQVQSARGDQAAAKPNRQKPDASGGRSARSTPPPPPAVRRWLTYMLAFGVSVAVGLAPLLGSQAVPLFSPLLNLIPDIFRESLVPVTSALMGLVAVGVQWYSDEDLDRAARRKALKWFLASSLAGVLAFYVISIFVVRTVEYGGAKDRERTTFLIGFVRPFTEKCPAGISDAQCIENLTYKQENVTGFWGDTNVNLANLALSLTYLTFMLGFASAVGIVMYRKGDSNGEASDKLLISTTGSHDDLLHVEEENRHSSPHD